MSISMFVRLLDAVCFIFVRLEPFANLDVMLALTEDFLSGRLEPLLTGTDSTNGYKLDLKMCQLRSLDFRLNPTQLDIGFVFV